MDGTRSIGRKYIPDQRVDLDCVHIVQLLQGLLNLALVRLDIDNENEGVVFFNLLHGALRVERVDNDFVMVQTGLMRDRFARIFGRSRELEGLGAMESSRSAYFAHPLGIQLFVNRFSKVTSPEVGG